MPWFYKMFQGKHGIERCVQIKLEATAWSERVPCHLYPCKEFAGVWGMGAVAGASLCNRDWQGARATVEAPVASSLKLGALPKFSHFSQRASEPANHTSLVHACSDHTEGLSWVFVIVLSQPRHDPLTHPRDCGRPCRACFCGRLPLATLPSFRVLRRYSPCPIASHNNNNGQFSR